MKLYTVYTESHKELFEKYFRPSIDTSFELIAYQQDIEGNGNYCSEGYMRCLVDKTDLVVKSVKDNIGSVIAWSDVDVVFKNLTAEILRNDLDKTGKDIAFSMLEIGGDSCFGFHVMKCNDKTLWLWENISKRCKERRHEYDQVIGHHFMRENKYTPGYLDENYYNLCFNTEIPNGVKMFHAACATNVGNKINAIKKFNKEHKNPIDFIGHASNIYKDGENVQSYLESMGFDRDDKRVIEISYDIQAGYYIDLYKKNKEQNSLFIKEISDLISLNVQSDIHSIMDMGCGEGTTILPLVTLCDKLVPAKELHGCDVSQKRLDKFKEFQKEFGVEFNLIKSGMDKTDFPDSRFDLVTTCHSIEPNSSSCLEILSEIFRMANKYVVLIEPVYELSSDEQKQRMDILKYFKGLNSFIDSQSKFKKILQSEIKSSLNKLNMSTITILSRI